MEKGKKILVGVTGSISAYKSAFLVRLLVKQGHQVKVLMTEAATEFIAPVTLSTLSKNTALISFYTSNKTDWNNHVELGLWADLFIIAPASANSLAKMATGLCDNLLLATYLSAKCPVFFAPAMDLDMWLHPATQENIKRLQGFGNQLLAPESGELASGLNGQGRLMEPESIVKHIDQHFQNLVPNKELSGQTVLLTFGPTVEAIDPVRFITNSSSGKMGLALAQAFAEMGSKVIAVHGPVKINLPKHPEIEYYPVQTAVEMLNRCEQFHSQSTIAVFCAAVSDYRPASPAGQKIKRKSDTTTLELVANPDISKMLGEKKSKHQFHVGFALETNNGLENAEVKLKKKNLDLIILNQTTDPEAGFNKDTNKVTILSNTDSISFPVKPKLEVARDIVQHCIKTRKALFE